MAKLLHAKQSLTPEFEKTATKNNVPRVVPKPWGELTEASKKKFLNVILEGLTLEKTPFFNDLRTLLNMSKEAIPTAEGRVSGGDCPMNRVATLAHL